MLVCVLTVLSACDSAARPAGTRPETAAAATALATTPPELRPVFRALDTLLTAGARDTLRRISSDSLWLYHMSLGMYVRNEFGLWRGGPLADALRARGLRHPDDMSGVVVDAYRQFLRRERVDVDAAIRRVPPPPKLEDFKELPVPPAARTSRPSA